MLSTNSKNNLVLLVDCKNTTPTGSTMTQTATDSKTGPRENPQFHAALEQQLSIKKRSNFVLSPRRIISISAAQECKNLFRAAHKQQNHFRAAKQNRKDKKLEILTACSNAAVQGQQFLKMYVRWIVFTYLKSCHCAEYHQPPPDTLLAQK